MILIAGPDRAVGAVGDDDQVCVVVSGEIRRNFGLET